MGFRPSKRQVETRQGASSIALWVILLGLLALCAFATGCGNTLYAIEANSASSKLEEAKSLNAKKYAPYEYYYAKEHMRKAETEAAEADYGDATSLADTAEEYADKAIKLAREAERGAGR